MTTAYTPRTGQPCGCKPGVVRDNCPQCEGTGWAIDFVAIRARAQQKLCPCGSGEPREDLTDARGIFCAFVCSKCEDSKRARYRTDIFTDSNYWADEPIEEDD